MFTPGPLQVLIIGLIVVIFFGPRLPPIVRLIANEFPRLRSRNQRGQRNRHTQRESENRDLTVPFLILLCSAVLAVAITEWIRRSAWFTESM